MIFNHPVWQVATRISLLRYPPNVQYAAALAAFSLSFALRLAIHDVLPPGFPFITFFPAVVLTAFVSGVGPAVLVAVLGGLAAWYVFIPPLHAFSLQGSNLLVLAFYVLIVTVDIAVIHAMRTAVKELRKERARTDGLLHAQTTMFHELQHRVANNMQFVSALLTIQRQAIGASPESAQAVLEEAAERLAVMARIHRRLQDPQSSVSFQDHVETLCRDMIGATGRSAVGCEVDIRTAPASPERLLIVAMLIVEALTNSLKHAFADRAGGIILITLDHAECEGAMRLEIADDGTGLPADFDIRRASGLGWSIMRNFVSQLDGRMRIEGDRGTRVEIVFPA